MCVCKCSSLLCVNVSTHRCVSACIVVYVCVCARIVVLYACVCVCVCVCIDLSFCPSICMVMCVLVCVFVFNKFNVFSYHSLILILMCVYTLICTLIHHHATYKLMQGIHVNIYVYTYIYIYINTS